MKPFLLAPTSKGSPPTSSLSSSERAMSARLCPSSFAKPIPTSSTCCHLCTPAAAASALQDRSSAATSGTTSV
jgi:hypothetical protein